MPFQPIRRLNTNITALHWDMDGTLVNTEELKLLAHQDAITRLGGRSTFSRHDYQALMGVQQEIVVREIIEQYDVRGSPSDYRAVWRTAYDNLVRRDARAHRGVREIFQLAHANRIKQAIVSSSSAMEIAAVLKKTRLDSLVDGIVSADDVENHKPHAEPYLRAMRITFGNRDNGIAIEATDTGCESALAAGLSVIGVRHELNYLHDFKGARRVLTVNEMANPELFLGRLLEP